MAQRKRFQNMSSRARRAAASPLQTVQDALREFAAVRDWDQFHTPKNLAMALTVEASELLECFLWASDSQSKQLSGLKRNQVRDEMADVFIYLVRLADKLNIDLLVAATDKMAKNEKRYPAAKTRGSSKKYTEL